MITTDMAEGKPTCGFGKNLFANARLSKVLCIPVSKEMVLARAGRSVALGNIISVNL